MSIISRANALYKNFISKHFSKKINDNFKFLIVGAGRGGTSLLAGLLDYHSDLEVGLELHAAGCLMGKELTSTSSNSKLFDERVSEFILRCKQTARGYSQKLWGNKITTEHIFGLEDRNVLNPHAKIEILDIFFNHYLKNIKIIFILRDGRACIQSKMKRTGQSLETATAKWQYSVKCYSFLRDFHSNNICIRFEDLLTDPTNKLMETCDFLGIAYQEKMLMGVANEKMRPEYRKEKLEISKTKIPELFPVDCLNRIKKDLEYCGYMPKAGEV